MYTSMQDRLHAKLMAMLSVVSEVPLLGFSALFVPKQKLQKTPAQAQTDIVT